MPYKDIQKQREAVKRATQRYRGITEGITEQGITSEGITEYPEVLHALTDPIKRAKIQTICKALDMADLSEFVYRGAGSTMIRADKLLEMLRVTA